MTPRASRVCHCRVCGARRSLQIFAPLMLREIRGQSPAVAQTICHGDLICVVMVISIEPEHCVRVRTRRSSASVTVCRYIGILGSRYNRYLCLLQQEAGVTTCRACLVWLNQTSSTAEVHTAHVTMQRLQLTRKTIKCSSEVRHAVCQGHSDTVCTRNPKALQ